MAFHRNDSICARGPVPYWLGQCSVDIRAVERLTGLRDAIKGLGPTYEGLERVFDEHLGAHYCNNADLRRRIAEHLRQHWFNDAGYFPGQKVTQIYAEGVIKTIDLSLNGRHHPVPINAWWIIDEAGKVVRMLNLVEVDRNGSTVSSSVTLLITTPRPSTGDAPTRTLLWSDSAAWETALRGNLVVTRQIENEGK
ncbi:MAG TPA: hypothetical protein VKX28_31055 [Xanthobacteraceae bacterium]|nr:hypothetical protein [Xanthobacteraceae bacterium]